MDVFDAALRYSQEGTPVVILAGKEYGSGSSRDWAAKGPWMQASGKGDAYFQEMKTSWPIICIYLCHQLVM